MSRPSSMEPRRAAGRPAAMILLIGTLALVLGLLAASGAGADSSVSAGTTPTGGSGTSEAPATPRPSDPATGDNDDGTPHADTAEEMTGRDLSPGRLAFIITVASVTVVIIVALVFRGRRKREVGRGDLQ